MQHTTSSPQQFCLRWNNYQSNLTNVFDQLLQSESFVDVTLACDGHSVKAHKMVLSACSPYFQSLFFENPCQHPIVIMRDIKWPELKAAVEFMYKGEINVSQEQIGPLLKVAESLKIRGLADVNGEQDVVAPAGELTARPSSAKPASSTAASRCDWGERAASGGGTGGGGQPSQDADDPSCRAKKRRRVSGERSGSSAASSPCDTAGLGADATGGVVDAAGGPDMSPATPGGGGGAMNAVTVQPQPVSQGQQQPQQGEQPLQLTLQPLQAAQSQPQTPQPTHQQQQQQQQQHAAMAVAAHQQMAHSSTAAAAVAAAAAAVAANAAAAQAQTTDDLEIKPGIAEMIREEERAKLLESSHAWLGASTSSIADYPAMLKLKTPTWSQAQLKEAIEAVVTQKMRFTQASSRYGIPKGTLYDNILGKSKRMAVLEEAGLTSSEEAAVLEFCCSVSVSPYNRRTKKSLQQVLNFVEKLRRRRDPEFMFTGLSGFRWWWAFCKKHSIVSLYYECDKDGTGANLNMSREPSSPEGAGLNNTA